MAPETFNYILQKIEPNISKKDTIFRLSIPAAARLEATLLFLATGESYARLEYFTRIDETTLGKIIPEVCEAIYSCLGKDLINFPRTADEWQNVASGFEQRWNFPNCCGAIDGKHVAIAPPPQSGSYYYNYKGSHSIFLLAVANANYEILYADVGANGRISDGGAWGRSSLCRLLQSGDCKLPEPKLLPNSTRKLPFVFVGDDAFPLKKNLLKPFPHLHQSEQQRIFSYRLSRARMVIESTFGIMANRFHILQTKILLEPNKVVKILLAIISLHNLFRREANNAERATSDQNGYIPCNNGNTSSLTSMQQDNARNASEEAKKIRKEYMEYFCNEGQVSWQRRFAGLE